MAWFKKKEKEYDEINLNVEISILKKDIKELNRRLIMVECPHSIDDRKFTLSDAEKYCLISKNSFSYYYGCSICTHCEKTIKVYLDEKEYKKDYVIYLQEKINKINNNLEK